MIVFDPESTDFRDVDVIEQLGGTRLLLELFPRRRGHARDRNELQCHWFTRSDVFGFVGNRAAGPAEFSGGTIAFRANAVVLGKSCLFHDSCGGPAKAPSSPKAFGTTKTVRIRPRRL